MALCPRPSPVGLKLIFLFSRMGEGIFRGMGWGMRPPEPLPAWARPPRMPGSRHAAGARGAAFKQFPRLSPPGRGPRVPLPSRRRGSPSALSQRCPNSVHFAERDPTHVSHIIQCGITEYNNTYCRDKCRKGCWAGACRSPSPPCPHGARLHSHSHSSSAAPGAADKWINLLFDGAKDARYCFPFPPARK